MPEGIEGLPEGYSAARAGVLVREGLEAACHALPRDSVHRALINEKTIQIDWAATRHLLSSEVLYVSLPLFDKFNTAVRW